MSATLGTAKSWNDWARHWCECDHRDSEHNQRKHRCRGLDSYGIRCTCPSFVMDQDGLDHANGSCELASSVRMTPPIRRLDSRSQP